MARYLLTTAAVLALALAAALWLGLGREPPIATVAGNYAFVRGDYVAATIHYLAAAAGGAAGPEPSRQPYLDYNLGSTYLALGEAAAGMELLRGARATDHRLRGRAAFNLGNAHYESGNYRAAALSYRDALLLAPDSVDAKINLELALRRLQTSSPAAATHRRPAAAAGAAQTARILEFIRRREPPPPVRLPRDADAAGY